MIAEHEQRVLDLIDAQQQEIEAEFEKFLGVTNPIWLTGVDGNDPVLGPEETDCHIDLMCRFVNEDTVLYGWHEQVDESDPAFQRVFSVMLDELRNARSEADKPLNLVPVPAPKYPVYSTNAHAAVGHIAEAGRGILAACGPKMWYSGYMDWHVANGVVLVPILGDVNDERALAIIGDTSPGATSSASTGAPSWRAAAAFTASPNPRLLRRPSAACSCVDVPDAADCCTGAALAPRADRRAAGVFSHAALPPLECLVPECHSGWRLVSDPSPAIRRRPNQGCITICSESVF